MRQVVLRCASSRAASAWRDGAREVAGDEREGGAVHLDRARGAAAELVGVDARRAGHGPAPACRSMSCSRSATPSNALLAMSPPTKPDRQHWPVRRRRRSGSSLDPRRITASRRSRASAGIASSTRSAARSVSPGSERVPDREDRRRRPRRTRRWPGGAGPAGDRAARRAGGRAGRRRRGGGSGTSAAGRRAGRRRGCARSSASSICPAARSSPVTASHSGSGQPVEDRRSRSRKSRTSAGWRSSTSSTR